MGYSKSYMFFGVVLFVILYFQVLTAIDVHDESSVTESNLPLMVVQPTDEQTFSLFDSERNGYITTKKLMGIVMRLLGHIPTNAELHVIKNKVDVGIIGYLVQSLEWITENFTKFDEDHNDLISVDEFRHFATKYNNHEKMTVEAANNIFSVYDINGDGQLDLDEFINMMILMIKGRDKLCGVNCNKSNLPPMVIQPTNEQNLEVKKTFNLFNNGKDGSSITTKEFRNVMQSLGVHIIGFLEWYLEWIKEIFIKFDEDHNDLLSVEEFHDFATQFDNHEMTVEATNNTISGYDIDGDGQLDLDEFTNIVRVMIYGHK
ncbi:calmodulin [Trifolium repens]|nr:calmodulin [Trifolium repens]